MKSDEFYTLREDIEKELNYYIKQYENKIIYLNCDNPMWSQFYAYFDENFNKFKLKKLITTHKEWNKESFITIKERIENEEPTRILPQKDGSFQSYENDKYLKESDIIISNPPFSISCSYLRYITKYNKKFIFICYAEYNKYPNFVEKINNGEMWLGVNHHIKTVFKTPKRTFSENCKKELKEMGFPTNEKYAVVPISWYTNMKPDIKEV